jgi:MSHA biogenesis protein MshP
LVAAIFVLVVLAALGVFIVTIGEVQRSTTTTALQGARAYFAAQSGLEWGIYQAVPPGGGSSCPGVGLPTTFSPAGTGFNGFTVTVTCVGDAGNPYGESGGNVNIYAVTSTATFGTFGTPDYFSRTLQITVTDAPAP